MNSIEMQCLNCNITFDLEYNDESEVREICKFCGGHLVPAQQNFNEYEFAMREISLDVQEFAIAHGRQLTKKQYANAFAVLTNGIKLNISFDVNGNITGISLKEG